MRRTKLIGLGCLALATSMAVSACSSSDSDSASDGKVTLHVIGWKGGPAEPGDMKKINAAFEASHPNIKIDYEIQPSNDAYSAKLNAEFLGGNAQDVLMIRTQDIQRYAKSGYLSDLSEQPWASQLSDPVKGSVSNAGKLYGQPTELVGVGLFSNMKILKEAGITEPPTTWPELIADLKKLKAAKQPGLALPNKSGFTVYEAINANASHTVFADNPNWNEDLLAGKTSFADTPGWKTAMQQIVDLGEEGLIDYKEQLGVDEWSQGGADFKAGKSAFLLQGSWSRGDLAKGVPDLQFTPWPGGQAGQPPAALTAIGTIWGVNAKSEHQEAAKEYLEFWATPTALKPYLTAESAISPFTSVPTPAIPGAGMFVSTVSDDRYWILPETSWAGGQSQTAKMSAVQALLLGDESIDQTLATYDSSTTKD